VTKWVIKAHQRAIHAPAVVSAGRSSCSNRKGDERPQHQTAANNHTLERNRAKLTLPTVRAVERVTPTVKLAPATAISLRPAYASARPTNFCACPGGGARSAAIPAETRGPGRKRCRFDVALLGGATVDSGLCLLISTENPWDGKGHLQVRGSRWAYFRDQDA